jgi:hypothetical protein
VLLEVLDLLRRYFNEHLKRSAAALDALHADESR